MREVAHDPRRAAMTCRPDRRRRTAPRRARGSTPGTRSARCASTTCAPRCMATHTNDAAREQADDGDGEAVLVEAKAVGISRRPAAGRWRTSSPAAEHGLRPRVQAVDEHAGRRARAQAETLEEGRRPWALSATGRRRCATWSRVRASRPANSRTPSRCRLSRRRPMPRTLPLIRSARPADTERGGRRGAPPRYARGTTGGA